MGFVKVIKNKAYYSRFQVKNRRRRQGKTDYYARRRLIQQDKNKYDTKKYRFVVRRTNKKILTQIIWATIQGDRVLCQADSSELKNFGLEAGLTNYASAYATGLLCARRLLKQLGLNDMYKGVEKPNGELYDLYGDNQGERGEKRPFKAFLDVGLVRTTTGNRVFGAMKGAVDGGVYIPHNNKRFPGYSVEKKVEVKPQRGKKKQEAEEDAGASSFDAAVHRDHIFGKHVQGYMDLLKKENKSKFESHFSKWIKCLAKNKANNVEALYTKVHAEIRKNPDRKKVERKGTPVHKAISKDKARVFQDSKGRKWLRHKKLSREERKARVISKIQKAMGA
jgi:large subunit ribosomal protein L5e